MHTSYYTVQNKNKFVLNNITEERNQYRICRQKEINIEYDAFWVTASFHICGPQT